MDVKVFDKDLRRLKSITVNETIIDELHQSTVETWQNMLDLLCKSIDVKVIYIMALKENKFIELFKSVNGVYSHSAYRNSSLGTGLFCETVLGKNQELLVENFHDEWPNAKENTQYLSSYLGLPIPISNKSFLGTLCLFDDKPIVIDDINRDLLYFVRDSIEKDIKLYSLNKEISKLSVIDPETGMYNKHKMDEISKEYQYEIARKIAIVAVSYFSINNYNDIRKSYGDKELDDIIQLFGKIILNRARKVDRIGRVSKNEYQILAKGSNAEGLEVLLLDLKKYFSTHLEMSEYGIELAYGIETVNHEESIIKKTSIAKRKMIDYSKENFTK